MSMMNESTPKRSPFSLQLHPRNLFLPATLLAVFLLKWKLDLPWWGLAMILSILPVYYFVLPRVIKKKERAFERDVLRLLQQGRKGELLELYRRQKLLRLLGPSDKLQRRLGFIYSEVGDFDRARACYARAARSAGPGERLTVLLGLASARYRSGDYEGAEVVYRELLRRGQHMPEVLGGLAHSLLLQEKELGEAMKLIKKAQELALEGPLAVSLRLTMAEALLARGKPGKARKLVESTEAPAGDRWLEARRTWALALLALNDGDHVEARELLDDAARLDEGAGLGDVAAKRLAELNGEDPNEDVMQWAG